MVFVRNKGDYDAYADKVMGHDPILVDVEQDVPVSVYHVPNGTNYDVYVLSSDVIYAPVDCSNLCNGMSKLEMVDTSNLDVSHTENMYRMFRDCTALKSIDVSNWDTSNVTNMRDLFRNCKSVTELAVSEWDVSNVATMLAMFQDCVLVTELDLNSWDMSRVMDTSQMFNRCGQLGTLLIDKWNTKSISNATAMFQYCKSLTGLDLSGWDTSAVTLTSATIMSNIFSSCRKLKELNIPGFDTRKVSDGMGGCFASMNSLEMLVLGENFKFAGNGSLTGSKRAALPAPANIEGADGKWHNAVTGEAFAKNEIPEGAATYVAVYPANP